MCLGIPGQIIEMRPESVLATGLVDFGGARRDVCLAYVDGQVAVGDFVLVHVGFAMKRRRARRTPFWRR
jgi:hydrogenase expression/formation protein HypC